MKTIIPLKVATITDLLALKKNLLQAKKHINVIEIWLGTFSNEEMTKSVTFLAEFAPVLGVLRSPVMGGSFVGNAEEKKQKMQTFFNARGQFFDIDIEKDKKLLPLLPKTWWKKIILSTHNFTTIPDLQKTLKNMQQWQPLVYKLAVTPKNKADIHNFVTFIKNFPEKNVIATTMGQHGKEGRQLLAKTEKLWGHFIALRKDLTTANGQTALEV